MSILQKRNMKTLFVKNLNFSISNEEIEILFSVFGEIKSFKRPLDKRTKLKQGFCFIEMSDSDADLAMKALDGSELGGRVLTVELSNKTKKTESEKSEENSKPKSAPKKRRPKKKLSLIRRRKPLQVKILTRLMINKNEEVKYRVYS